jgi:hypothetical protein
VISVDWHWCKPKPQDLSYLHNSGLSRTANRLARGLGLARVCFGDCRRRNAFPSRQSRLRYSATTRQVRSQRLVGLQPPDTGKRAFPHLRIETIRPLPRLLDNALAISNATKPICTPKENYAKIVGRPSTGNHVQRRRTIPFQARKSKALRCLAGVHATIAQ